MRVMLLLAWPWTNTALILSFCATSAFGRIAASNQRVSGMPGVSISFLSSKREAR
jgi:hypothetical protein